MPDLSRRDFIAHATTAGAAVVLLPVIEAFAASATTPPTEEWANGVVFEDPAGHGVRSADSRGIAGVLVSNGRDVVRTDHDGAYRIAVRNGDVLFVIKPQHYRTPVSAFNLPKFYYFHRPTGSPRWRATNVPGADDLDPQWFYPGSDPTGPIPVSDRLPPDTPVRARGVQDRRLWRHAGDPRAAAGVDGAGHRGRADRCPGRRVRAVGRRPGQRRHAAHVRAAERAAGEGRVPVVRHPRQPRPEPGDPRRLSGRRAVPIGVRADDVRVRLRAGQLPDAAERPASTVHPHAGVRNRRTTRRTPIPRTRLSTRSHGGGGGDDPTDERRRPPRRRSPARQGARRRDDRAGRRPSPHRRPPPPATTTPAACAATSGSSSRTTSAPCRSTASWSCACTSRSPVRPTRRRRSPDGSSG